MEKLTAPKPIGKLFKPLTYNNELPLMFREKPLWPVSVIPLLTMRLPELMVISLLMFQFEAGVGDTKLKLRDTPGLRLLIMDAVPRLGVAEREEKVWLLAPLKTKLPVQSQTPSILTPPPLTVPVTNTDPVEVICALASTVSKPPKVKSPSMVFGKAMPPFAKVTFA